MNNIALQLSKKHLKVMLLNENDLIGTHCKSTLNKIDKRIIYKYLNTQMNIIKYLLLFALLQITAPELILSVAFANTVQRAVGKEAALGRNSSMFCSS